MSNSPILVIEGSQENYPREKENQMALYTLEEIRQEIQADKNHLLADNYPQDRASEYADSAVPVYYHQIIDEWNDLETDDQNRFSEITTELPDRIEDLMKTDLYLYYYNAYTMAINELLEAEGVE